MEQEPELSIAYPVKYRFMYEPIFVARTNAPQYDEMFIGYGMTRNTQVSMTKEKSHRH